MKELGKVNHYTVSLSMGFPDGDPARVSLIPMGFSQPAVTMTIPEFAAVLAMAQAASREEMERRLLREHLER
jgi:hypothetical protein